MALKINEKSGIQRCFIDIDMQYYHNLTPMMDLDITKEMIAFAYTSRLPKVLDNSFTTFYFLNNSLTVEKLIPETVSKAISNGISEGTLLYKKNEDIGWYIDELVKLMPYKLTQCRGVVTSQIYRHIPELENISIIRDHRSMRSILRYWYNEDAYVPFIKRIEKLNQGKWRYDVTNYTIRELFKIG